MRKNDPLRTRSARLEIQYIHVKSPCGAVLGFRSSSLRLGLEALLHETGQVGGGDPGHHRVEERLSRSASPRPADIDAGETEIKEAFRARQPTGCFQEERPPVPDIAAETQRELPRQPSHAVKDALSRGSPTGGHSL